MPLAQFWLLSSEEKKYIQISEMKYSIFSPMVMCLLSLFNVNSWADWIPFTIFITAVNLRSLSLFTFPCWGSLVQCTVLIRSAAWVSHKSQGSLLREWSGMCEKKFCLKCTDCVSDSLMLITELKMTMWGYLSLKTWLPTSPTSLPRHFWGQQSVSVFSQESVV